MLFKAYHKNETIILAIPQKKLSFPLKITDFGRRDVPKGLLRKTAIIT